MKRTLLTIAILGVLALTACTSNSPITGDVIAPTQQAVSLDGPLPMDTCDSYEHIDLCNGEGHSDCGYYAGYPCTIICDC